MNSQRLYVPLYAATILLSAFLLFSIQPLFGKMILPMLGGAPSVWNLAMAFFQMALLGGYFYAHALSRLRGQAVIHVLVLLVCAVLLPVAIPSGWEPPATDNPSLWQLKLMAVAVGGPFFALSATAPLLQHWFSRTRHPDAQNPYFLYAASNVGSLGALLLYPLAIEPLLTLRQQSVDWAIGYGVLAVLIALCAALVRGGSVVQEESGGEPLQPRQIGLWLLLAFIPSSLMLGVTTYITTDIASAPLLWVVPLALYVASFIVAFARKPPIGLDRLYFWQPVLLTAVMAIFIPGHAFYRLGAAGLHLALFFVTAVMCHMQLAAMRPSTRHLTVFYLVLSTGGALGGMFNALLAPVIFKSPAEYPLMLALSAFACQMLDPAQSWRAVIAGWRQQKPQNKAHPFLLGGAVLMAMPLTMRIIDRLQQPQPSTASNVIMFILFATSLAVLIPCMASLIRRRWAFAVTASVILMLSLSSFFFSGAVKRMQTRNFFGVLRVVDVPEAEVRLFTHGTTIHGAQALDQRLSMTPLTYYYNQGTPAADVFGFLVDHPGEQQVAAIGLGVGSIDCYTHPGRHIDFYEIDPDVKGIAENPKLFTYLTNCGTPYRIIIGDGRLRIAKAADGTYDMIFLDAFSSDNIPVHLLTKEALALYLRKLKPGGFIAMNISNRHIDLKSVIAAAARDLGVQVLFQRQDGGTLPDSKVFYAPSVYAVLAPAETDLSALSAKGWQVAPLPPKRKAWRDDFSDIISVLH